MTRGYGCQVAVLAAWVRAPIAERSAVRSARIVSAAPPWDFVGPAAMSSCGAPAAIFASSGPDWPESRRDCRPGRINSTRSTFSGRSRWVHQAPYETVPSTPRRSGTARPEARSSSCR